MTVPTNNEEAERIAKHVRNIAHYEGITEGQASVLRKAANLLAARRLPVSGDNAEARSQWNNAVQAERQRQRDKGYDASHDAQHGVDHLLMEAQEYARRGESVKSAALVEAAREILLSASHPREAALSGTEREAALRAVVEAARGKMSETEWLIASREPMTAYRVYADAVLAAGFSRTSHPVQVEPAPSDTEREALEQATLYGYQAVWDDGKFDADPAKNAWMWERVQIAVKAAVERAARTSHPVQVEVSEGMVARAAHEYHERGNGEGSFERASEHVRTSLLFRMRCALSAALGGGGE